MIVDLSYSKIHMLSLKKNDRNQTINDCVLISFQEKIFSNNQKNKINIIKFIGNIFFKKKKFKKSKFIYTIGLCFSEKFQKMKSTFFYNRSQCSFLLNMHRNTNYDSSFALCINKTYTKAWFKKKIVNEIFNDTFIVIINLKKNLSISCSVKKNKYHEIIKLYLKTKIKEWKNKFKVLLRSKSVKKNYKSTQYSNKISLKYIKILNNRINCILINLVIFHILWLINFLLSIKKMKINKIKKKFCFIRSKFFLYSFRYLIRIQN
ncbi:hypothetical protein (nucleomorph) [Guillardia theta]|uniref:Uncharacterized protein n=1 Tax=Guillardia theta TaxID=55529 RepID=Q98RM7_GUITH|nr:hypothetical protein GTHECHR1128 [Guillardia theta]AAK39921.1 hypothetical protein [Guillardia theta]